MPARLQADLLTDPFCPVQVGSGFIRGHLKYGDRIRQSGPNLSFRRVGTTRGEGETHSERCPISELDHVFPVKVGIDRFNMIEAKFRRFGLISL